MRKSLFPGIPLWLLAILLLGGCSLVSEYKRPAVDLPEQWPDAIDTSMVSGDEWREWWQRYQDPVLDDLVASALENNIDIALAVARIREARASLGLTRAAELPTVEGQGNFNRQDFGDASPIGGGGIGIVRQYRLAAELSYEIDLWGRLANATRAAQERLLGSAFSKDAVRLNIITNVVVTYFELRAAQEQIDITQNTIKARKESLALEQARLDFGASTELALNQAEAELESTRAELPALQARVHNLRRALGILIGNTPKQLVLNEALPEGNLADIHFSTKLPSILPSSMLERRPDIRAAEAALAAANADIGVARANWFPRINLLAVLGTGSSQSIGNLFSSPATLWQLGGSLVQPLFDGGARRFEVEGAEVRYEIAELQYRANIRQAFIEVGDAWSLLEAGNDELEIRNHQVNALQKTVELAQNRYQGGFSSYLEVLDAKRALFQAELQRTDAARNRLNATASLFKALGGGWTESGAITEG